MTLLQDIYKAIDFIAPFSSAMDFDNVGLLVGNADKAVRRVMFALDITADTVEEAAGKNVDLIISHHPVIFSPLYSLDDTDVAYQLISKGIAALCCHTNLDIAAEYGVNVALGSKLGLSSVHGAKEYGEGYSVFAGLLEEPMEPLEFVKHVKKSLDTGMVSFHKGSENIQKICFCSGSGGEYLMDARAAGAQAYVTGEMKHHEKLLAKTMDMTVVEAGHYETEVCFADLLGPYLRRQFPDLGFINSVSEKAPMEYI